MNNPTYNILYPMAIDTQGQLISAVLAMGKQEYTCIDCASRMVVRKGEKVQHHFAHFADTNITRACNPESAIHKAGKRILREKISHALIAGNPIYFAWKCSCCDGDAQLNIIQYGNWIAEEISLPQSLIRPDLTLYKDKSPKLAIEIVKSNYPSDEKIKYFTELNLASFIIEVAPEDDLMSKWQDNIIAGYFATPGIPGKYDIKPFTFTSIPKAFPICDSCYYQIVNHARKQENKARCEWFWLLDQRKQSRINLQKIKDNYIQEFEDTQNAEDNWEIATCTQKDKPKIWEIPGIGIIVDYKSEGNHEVWFDTLEISDILAEDYHSVQAWLELGYVTSIRKYDFTELEECRLVTQLIIHANREEFIKYHRQSQKIEISETFNKIWEHYQWSITGYSAMYSVTHFQDWLLGDTTEQKIIKRYNAVDITEPIIEIPGYGIFKNIPEQRNEPGLYILEYIPQLHELPSGIVCYLLENEDADWDELYEFMDDYGNSQSYIESSYFLDISANSKSVAVNIYPSIRAFVTHKSIVSTNHKFYEDCLSGIYENPDADEDEAQREFSILWETAYSKPKYDPWENSET